MNPLFSCVVAVKGARPYFDAALASLHGQGMGEELEIIVQDGDAEPDHGQSDAFNRGFAKACGEWLFWLNADDLLLPGALRRIQSVIEDAKRRTPEQSRNWYCRKVGDDIRNLSFSPRLAAQCCADGLSMDKPLSSFVAARRGGNESMVSGPNFTTMPNDSLFWIVGNQILIDDAGRILKCLRGNGWHDALYREAVPHVNGPSAFFRRELFARVGGFDASLDVCMDWDLWIRFMHAGARFVRIDEYLWAQRQWSGSKTQRTKRPDEAAWQGAEVQRMLRKNDFRMTRKGDFGIRLWRTLNGNYLRGAWDTLRMRGRTI